MSIVRTAFSAVFAACDSRISSTSVRPFHASAICSASDGPPVDDQPVNTMARGFVLSASACARRTPARQTSLMPCEPSAPNSW